MSNEIPKQYNPRECEDKWYKFWEENNYFSARANPAKKPFSIVIPPPNVTGILHMGHALNNTIQDILIRYHRMQGEESLWMPGTDHAGIATQNVVEKALAKENIKRQDLGREKFIEKVWLWKEQYGSAIIRQLKKLGASCDWSRIRFTMDEEYSKAIVEVFVRLYEKGLIYQGNYIINWCPRCQTALSDEEAPHKELQGNLYYLRYPIVVSRKSLVVSKAGAKGSGKKTDDEYIVVATTRPETMLGDTAVAVNPKDKRYKHLIGESIILPLVNREIKIISDNSVDVKFGTGAVKVTPAHDPNDYALGKKHKLEFINVMRADGRMNENSGDYKDMDRFEAREVILEDLKEKGFLEKVEPHQLSAGHCYRCHTIIEPYLSKQWFVKMKPLAKEAIRVVKKGKIKFHPERWTKVYLNWMENIQDWCISRQIWWGHRLPVYYCKNCLTNDQRLTTNDKGGVIVSRTKPEKCPECGSTDIYQDDDVLDTWFSSWLWPFATFGWPFGLSHMANGISQESHKRLAISDKQKDLDYFYPTSVLVTAPEIIFFWVARMIMAGLEFMQDIPFRDVYIHGTVRDTEGKKMSKSLGNIIDPLDIIKEFGTDALRFSLISITAQGQDVFLSKERFEQGRNFANKIWNASRFILMNLQPEQTKADLCVFFKKENLSLENRWILSRFYSVLKELNSHLDSLKFNEAANLLYGFFWHEFCDWYLEIIKADIKNPQNQIVMYKVLEKFLRILHPLMPFLTEEIWQKFNNQPTTKDQRLTTSIMIQPWPHVQEQMIDKKYEELMQSVFDVIVTIRNMRSELEIPLQDTISSTICSPQKKERELLASCAPIIKNLTKTGEVDIKETCTRGPGQFVMVLKDMHIVIPLSGLIDIAAHRKKTEEKIAKAEAEIKRKKELLENANFSKNAPEEIVEKEKARLSELNELVKKLKAVKDALQ
ncbi:MAG: valine--tRNA ligase [Candidatus Omnitrophica bacterium]|nr:valine--tRNA ligase [Candidatus Omnitrophota bacterium]